MRQVKNATFNKELLDRINRLRELVTNNVTAENIHLFDAATIRRSRELISDIDDAKWLDTCNINSVETSKINQIVRYLKTNKVEFAFDSTVMVVAEPNITDTNCLYAAVETEIPKGFSPKNTFVMYDITKIRTADDSIVYNGVDQFIVDNFHVSDRASSCKINISKSSNKLIFKISLNPAGDDLVSTIKARDIRLVVPVIFMMWRYV